MLNEQLYTPLVSIIIPIYKVEKWLPKCLNSCINQTYTNLEILAINDGSPDNCKEIIKEFAKRDNRIILIDKPNEGLNSAREMGIKNATGEFITILDGDDFFELNSIEILLSHAINEKVDIVVGTGRFIRESDNAIVGGLISCNSGMYSSVGYLKHVLERGPYTVCMKLYKANIVKAKTGYPDLLGIEDLILTMQWGHKAHQIISIPAVVYNYVVGRPGSILSENHRRHVEGSFNCVFFLFEWLTKSELTHTLRRELVNFLCFRLYLYLHNPKNNFVANKKKIFKMNHYLHKNVPFINGRQYKVLVKLLLIDVNCAHFFVVLMQKIKPTFHRDYKRFI